MNDRRKGLTKKNIGDRPIKVIANGKLPGTAACHLAIRTTCVTSPSNSAAGGEVVACSESCLMLKLGSPGPCALCCLPADRDEDEWFHFVGSFAIGFCLPCHRRSQVDSLWKRISRLYTKVKQG